MQIGQYTLWQQLQRKVFIAGGSLFLGLGIMGTTVLYVGRPVEESLIASYQQLAAPVFELENERDRLYELLDQASTKTNKETRKTAIRRAGSRLDDLLMDPMMREATSHLESRGYKRGEAPEGYNLPPWVVGLFFGSLGLGLIGRADQVGEVKRGCPYH